MHVKRVTRENVMKYKLIPCQIFLTATHITLKQSRKLTFQHSISYATQALCNTDCINYLENSINFENITVAAGNKEINSQTNKAWRNRRGDSRKLWSMIDWNGKAETNCDDMVDTEETQKKKHTY